MDMCTRVHVLLEARGVRSSGVGVAGSYEAPNGGMGIKSGASEIAMCVLNF